MVNYGPMFGPQGQPLPIAPPAAPAPAGAAPGAQLPDNLTAPWARSEPTPFDQGIARNIIAKLGQAGGQQGMPAGAAPAGVNPQGGFLPPGVGGNGNPANPMLQQQFNQFAGMVPPTAGAHPGYGQAAGGPSVPQGAAPAGFVSREEMDAKLREMEEAMNSQVQAMRYAQEYGGGYAPQAPASPQPPAQGFNGNPADDSPEGRMQRQMQDLQTGQQQLAAQQQQLADTQWWNQRLSQFELEAGKHAILADPRARSIARNAMMVEVQRNAHRPVGAVVTGIVNDLMGLVQRQQVQAQSDHALKLAQIPGGIMPAPGAAAVPAAPGQAGQARTFDQGREMLRNWAAQQFAGRM